MQFRDEIRPTRASTVHYLHGKMSIENEEPPNCLEMVSSNLVPGVYVPIITPFETDGSEDLDLEAFKINVKRLAKAGCGIVLSGTLGEGNLLDSAEKETLVRAARVQLAAEGSDDKTPLIAGINGESLRQCVANARAASNAGADAVFVEPDRSETAADMKQSRSCTGVLRVCIR